MGDKMGEPLLKYWEIYNGFNNVLSSITADVCALVAAVLYNEICEKFVKLNGVLPIRRKANSKIFDHSNLNRLLENKGVLY